MRSTNAITETSGFFKLPGELHNKIYRLVLVDTVWYTGVHKRTFNLRKALVDASKQTRQEASKIFYAENRFNLRADGLEIERYASWLKSLGSHARSISRLEVTALLSKDAYMDCRWNAQEVSITTPLLSWCSDEKRVDYLTEYEAIRRSRKHGRCLIEALRVVGKVGLAGEAVFVTKPNQRMIREALFSQSQERVNRYYVVSFSPFIDWLELEVEIGSLFDGQEESES